MSCSSIFWTVCGYRVVYFRTCFRGLDRKTHQWCTTKMLCPWSHTHCIAQNLLRGPRPCHHQHCKLLSAVRLSPSVLQAGISKTSFEKSRVLQTSVLSFVSVKAFGKSCTLTVNWSLIISRNDLLERNQSAYRQNHSTETALLHITNCLLESTDQGRVSIRSLLDLPAAFDTTIAFF